MRTILSSLLESRTIDASQFNKAIFTEAKTHAGVTVDQEQALRLIAVYRCVRLNSETVASLPIDIFRNQDEDRLRVGKPTWMEQPNPETSWFSLVERAVTSWNLDGNVFIYTSGYDGLALPRELWILDPRKVEIKRDDKTKELYYLYDGTERLTPYNKNGARRGDVLHVPSFSLHGVLRGLSPIEMARQGIGLGLVTEKFGARFFGEGQVPSGVIELPAPANGGGKSYTQDQIDLIKANWEAGHAGSGRSHKPGVLTGGATWKPMTITPEHAQFLDTRKFQVTEIARLFGTPPHLVGDVEKSTSWGTGIEEQNRQWLNLGLMPQIVRLEGALNQFIPRGQYVKFNLGGFLRADMKTRYASYAIAIQNRWMNPNEVRVLEDMNKAEGLDEFLNPNIDVKKQEDADGA